MPRPPRCCGWGGLGNLGCARPFAGSNGFCRTWIKDLGAFVRLHEFGHNFGLSHAGSDSSQYGDRTAIMGNSYSLKGFNAPSRIQLGWLGPSDVVRYDPPPSPPPPPHPLTACLYAGACPNYNGCLGDGTYCSCLEFCFFDTRCCPLVAPPPPPPAPPLSAPALHVELRSLPLDPSGTAFGEASAIVLACPSCASSTPGYTAPGGQLVISYRTPHGYDAGIDSSQHNTISVHLQRAFEAGSEVYAILSAGQAYEELTGRFIAVCTTQESTASVIIATSLAEAACPSPSPPPGPPASPPLPTPPASPPLLPPPPPPGRRLHGGAATGAGGAYSRRGERLSARVAAGKVAVAAKPWRRDGGSRAKPTFPCTISPIYPPRAHFHNSNRAPGERAT